MVLLKRIFWKIIKNFLPEKMPDFGVHMYADFAKKMKMSFYKTIAKEIAKETEKCGDIKNILDIGTGPGFLLFEITKIKPKLCLVGLDLSKKNISIAEEEKNKNKTKNIFFMVGDANKTIFSDNECDFVISSGVLHLLKSPESAIEEWLRILRPGGNLWIYDSLSLMSVKIENNKKFLDEIKKNLNIKKLMIFRLMNFLQKLSPQRISTQDIVKIFENSKTAELKTIEYRENYIKIGIKKK